MSTWDLFLKKWFKAESLFPRRWKEDMIRGWQAVRSKAARGVDQTFSNVELARTRYRLERINRRLLEAYQGLGKRALDHWTGKGALTEEERKREFRRIGLLLEEQKNLIEQIRELDQPPPSEESLS